MEINIGMRYENSLSQRLNLAPQLLQWLHLLQTSKMDLAGLVREELESNPALDVGQSSTEEGPDRDGDNGSESSEQSEASPEPVNADAEDSASGELDEKSIAIMELDGQWEDGSPPGASIKSSPDNDADERHQFILDSITGSESLHEHLLKQLPLAPIPECDRRAAKMILGSIDASGYLSTPLAEIAAAINVPESRLERILAAVQTMEPAGVAARNLRECLLLQMKDTEEWRLARLIVTRYLDALGQEQYAAIADALDVREEDVLRARELIRTLNPSPGRTIGQHIAQYISPDVIVGRHDGQYTVELSNDDIPPLRISASCRRLLSKGNLNPAEVSYIRERIRAAGFLINGIRQRHETVRKVTEQIIFFQREYFDSADGRLKPLTMAKIADIVGVHETTVSRAVANKHIQTPRGLFKMRHFFQTGYSCADGSSMTPQAVKELIFEIFDQEDLNTPYRDVDIVGVLKKKGLRLARRTVSKYRKELGIPSSKERRLANTAAG